MVEPTPQLLPAEHGMHSDSAISVVLLLYLPAGQESGALAPAGQ